MEENIGNSVALLQRNENKTMIVSFCSLLFAVCFCLCVVCFTVFCFDFLALCYSSRCLYSALLLLAMPVPAFFALPVLLLIFELKGVLLESHRNAAQFCCGLE